MHDSPPTAERPLPAHLTPRYPGTYTLELTAACNHDCAGCGNVFDHCGPHLSAAGWIGLMQRIRPYVAALRLSGGECTLHPEFAAIVRACDDLDVPFVVFTNGRWRRRAELLELFAGCRNLGGLLISLHGHDAAAYRQFVGRDSFSEVCATIAAASQAGLRVVTNTILLTSTIGQLDRLVDLSLGLGAAAAAFSRYLGPPLPVLEPDPAQLRTALGQLAQLRAADERVLLNNCVPTCFDDGMPTRGCTSGLTHCAIDPLGNVRPCAHAPVMLGNALSTDMPTIWRSAALDSWRSLIPPACTSCAALARCRGGCRATAFQRDMACDPLAEGPAGITRQPVRTIRLSHDARPAIICRIHAAGAACHLISLDRRVTLAASALPVLATLDGQTTLDALGARYGQPALDLVGTLLEAGLLELR